MFLIIFHSKPDRWLIGTPPFDQKYHIEYASDVREMIERVALWGDLFEYVRVR